MLVSNARVFIVDRDMKQDLAIIPREHWARVRPKPGMFVSIRVVPTGKGGGGKSVLSIVLTIAVIAAAVYTGGLAAAAYPELGFAVGGVALNAAGLAVAGVVTLVGNALVNAIAPPPNPSSDDPQSVAAFSATAATLSITGAQNQANPLGPIPAVLGQIQVFPEMAAAQYTEIIGGVQYLNCVFDLGYGPLSIGSQLIGQIPLSEFDGLSTDYRRGIDEDDIEDRGNWDASTAAFPVSPDYGDKYTVSVAGMVNGVSYAVGDTIVYAGVTDDISNLGWDKNADKPVGLYTNTVHEDDYSLFLTNAGGPRSLFTRAGITVNRISADLTFQGLTTFDNLGNQGSRTVDVLVEYRIAGSGGSYLTDGVTLSDGTACPGGVASLTAASDQIVYFGILIDGITPGDYEVKFTRQTADSTSPEVRDDCYVTAIRSIVFTPPSVPSDHCIIALRVRATNQLNGIIQQYNLVAQCMQPTLALVGGVPTWQDPTVTRNPAWAALQVLAGSGNKQPLPDSRLDLDAWLAFAQRNDVADQNGEPMFSYDNCITQVSTVRQVVTDILATCRAYLTNRDGKVSVGWEQAPGAPVQLFTPRNSWDFQWERTFVDLPDALNLQFVDPDLGWQQNQISVFDDGQDATTAQLYETLPMPGVIRKSQIYREGRFRIAEAKLRPGTYRLSTDIEGLQVSRGSPVRVQHYVMKWGLGAGRIKSLVKDGGGNILSVTVDEVVTLVPTKTYGVRIRKADSTQVYSTIVSPNPAATTSTFILTSPIAAAVGPAIDPAPDDLVTFGEAGLESVDLIVKAINRLGNLSCTLQLVDAAPDLQNADTGPIPPFNTQTTFASQPVDSAPPAPIIAQIVSDERAMVAIPGGGWQMGIDVYLAPRSGVAVSVDSIVGNYRVAGSNQPWTSVRIGPFDNKIRFAPVQQDVSYEMQLFAISGEPRPGLASAVTYVANETVVGDNGPPLDVETLTLVNNKVDAPGYVSLGNVAGFKVSYKLGEDRVYGGAISAHPASPWVTLPFDISNIPSGTVTIFVTAVNTSGIESLDPAIIVEDISGPAIANVADTVDYGALGWPGTITGGAVGGGVIAAGDLSPFIPADDGAPLVPAADAADFVPTDAAGAYAELVYVAAFEPDSRFLPGQLTLSADVDGQYAIDYQTDTNALFVSADDTQPFISADDSAPFVPDLGDWQSFPGGLQLQSQIYNIRVTAAAGTTQGQINALVATLDIPNVTEQFTDLAIAPGGTLLPLVKTYKIGVIDPGITLLADGGTAVGVTTTISGSNVLVKTLDTSGASVAGHINASPRGG